MLATAETGPNGPKSPVFSGKAVGKALTSRTGSEQYQCFAVCVSVYVNNSAAPCGPGAGPAGPAAPKIDVAVLA